MMSDADFASIGDCCVCERVGVGGRGLKGLRAECAKKLVEGEVKGYCDSANDGCCAAAVC